MPERQSRAYAIVQELRLLGGYAEFTCDEATADNLRSASTPASAQSFGFQRHYGARTSFGFVWRAGPCRLKLGAQGTTTASDFHNLAFVRT